jgi:hypothetical protein
MPKRKAPDDDVTMMCDGTDMFVVLNGTKIAKRGHPGTPQAKTWISLEPGWIVVDVPTTDENVERIRIQYKDVPVQ